jgi:hypothetical protein
MGYCEPTSEKNGATVGSILTTPVTNMGVDKAQLLAKTNVKSNEAIVYYAVAVWDIAGKITDAEKRFNFLDTFYQEVKKTLVINVK